MLKIALAAVLLGAAIPAAAQMPDPAPLMAAEREAMAIFGWMDGTWRGQAVHRGPGGEKRVVHTERSGPLLGGTIRLVEGRAYHPNGGTAFNALAMISYDPQLKAFRMASHADGRFGVFKIEPRDHGYVWWVPAGPATIRYTGTFKDELWSEIGEYVADGQPPRKIFSMELRRIGASDWPQGGSVLPR